MERYAKNKQKAADDIQRLLKTKKQEFESCENKIRLASQQNAENKTAVNLTTCGNCHVKLGHTRKRCNYSPCKSAYSCGNLSKHVSDKLKISNLQREIAKLEENPVTAQSEIQSAESAVNKVMTSVLKQIEDVIVAECQHTAQKFKLVNNRLLEKFKRDSIRFAFVKSHNLYFIKVLILPNTYSAGLKSGLYSMACTPTLCSIH